MGGRLERAASLHLDTLATLASKGSPLQPAIDAGHGRARRRAVAAERAVAV